MSDTVWLALIAAGPGLLAAVTGMLNRQALNRTEAHLAETKTAVGETKTAVVELKKQTDGMTERIATLANQKGQLEGHAQGMVDAGAVPVVMIPQTSEVKT